MSEVFICGCGAVSPAGWGVETLRAALARGEPIPSKELTQPACAHPLRVRPVPAPSPRPAFLSHARLRRASPLAQYAVAAALEALGEDVSKLKEGALQLGVVLCATTGCVNYSTRFYHELLEDPVTASPLLFPETVFNAPASHLAALLGTTAINYTLVGDPGTFLQGIALAADWLVSGRVTGCLVVGAEEMDWLIADALYLFDRRFVFADGAGALYLRREPIRAPAITVGAVTEAHLFTPQQTPGQAAQRARAELGGNGTADLLCDGLQGVPRLDRAEEAAWRNWAGPRLSPKKVLGEGLMAAAAWQCVAAFDALQQNRYPAANVSVVGCNQQAIAARFVTSPASAATGNRGYTAQPQARMQDREWKTQRGLAPGFLLAQVLWGKAKIAKCKLRIAN